MSETLGSDFLRACQERMIYREIHLPGLHILTVEISGEFYKISTTYPENMLAKIL
jgi:hypothetical protein